MRQEDYRRLLDALLPSVLAAGRIEMAHFAAGVTLYYLAPRLARAIM